MALTVKKTAKLLSRGVVGRHFHTQGLYLDIESKTNAHWVRRYQLNGRSHYAGLGSAFVFSLPEAVERNRRMSQQLADGVDPLVVRRAERAKAAAAPETLTFAKAAQAYFDSNESTWTNKKARDAFLSTLKQYVFPRLGAVDVGAINVPSVLAVLEQKVPAYKHYPAGVFWLARSKTASRVRIRIKQVLDFAGVRGHRSGPNPADWEILQHVLPAPGKVAKSVHHRAPPYSEMSALVPRLMASEGVAARALAFTALVAARAGETLGAMWDEFVLDGDNPVWTVPAARMKARREHRVPLAPQVVELLRGLPTESDNLHVFIGSRSGARLSVTALAAALKRMGRSETVHGLRSSFSDWAHERTSFSNHAIELSLAHSLGNEVERAYRRGDMFDKRRKLMEAWARHCLTPPAAQTGKVVPMQPVMRR